MALLSRVLIFLGLMVVAVVLGLYLGKVSVGNDPIIATLNNPVSVSEGEAKKEGEGAKEKEQSLQAPPVYFYPGMIEDDNWNPVLEQIAMASESGVHQYIVTISPDWTDTDMRIKSERYASILQHYLDVDPKARFLIQVDLNPPVPWFEAHPDAAVQINDAFQPYPCPASVLWRDDAARVLGDVFSAMASSDHSKNILGYVLCALKGLRWMPPEGFDISKTNQQGFSEWLAQKYRTDAALQTAWGKPEITLAQTSIPSSPTLSENPPVFFMLPEMQPVVDFLQYSAESVADALVSLASATAKSSSNDPSFIIGAPYGFSFETFPNGYGHYALELLLESDLNALLSPVSYVDRGLGGVGGVMGPVDSMTIRGKQWIIIDDTRTGVERDPATGEFGRIKGINVDDVYEVQQRNFAQALAYGLGLVWADPQSEGWLHDADQWKHLGNLGAIYAQQIKAKETCIEQDYSVPVMTVVVDETSRFYVQPGGRAEGTFLQKGRDAAMRSGVSLRFHLLRDVIEDIAPPTPVYLFLNAFHLTETDRVRLHSRLAREQACAIWLYAPGYIAEKADAENIGATTGMDVRIFKAPFVAGSTYLLSGQFMRAEEKFGDENSWNPAFYIEPEENTDFLANYVNAKEKGSVAILTLPEGWTSVYIAEPGFNPALLCEILQLLEQHFYISPAEGIYYDTVSARDGILALHACQAGKRSINFGYYCDVVDLFDNSIGWQQKDMVLLPMQTGETRLFLHQPTRAGLK